MDKIQMENQANNKSIPIQDNINPGFNMSKTMNIINIFEHDIHSVNKNQKNMTEIDNQFNNNMMNLNQMNNQFNNNSMMNMNQGDDEFNNMMNMNQDNNQFNNNMMNMNQNESQFNNNMMNMNQDNNQFNNNMNNMNQDNSQFNNNMMNMNQDNNQFNNNNMMNMNQGDNPFNNNNMINMNQDDNPFNNNSMMNMNQINDQYNINQNNFMNNMGRKSVNLKYPTNFSEYNLDNNKKGLNRQRTLNIFENKISLYDEEIDAYPYIKEKKKLIIFERNDKKQVKVKVPLSLRNNELYFTAIKYKINEYSDMDLFHKNKFLKNDDSPIDNILDGDKVIMAEILDELDNSIYEKEYLPNLNTNDIINIIFKYSTGNRKPMTFSRKTKIKEMLKMFFQESKILEKAKHHYKITYDSEPLNFNDDSPIGDIFKADGSIAYVDQIVIPDVQGKQLKVSLKNKNKSLLEIKAGTLEQIKSFYSNLENNYFSSKKIKKVIIKGKPINKNDENTFASKGIRNNFTCNILFMGDQESKEDYNNMDENEEKGLFKNMPCLII